MPGIRAGELLFLDDSNKNHIVYRGVNNKNLWFSKDTVENQPVEIIPEIKDKPRIEYEVVEKELLSKDEADKLAVRIDEVYSIDVAVEEVVLVDKILN